MTSSLVSWIKSQFSIDEATGTEYISFTDIWNDFVDAYNEDFDWVTGTLFDGTAVTLVPIEVQIQIPANVNIPFFGDIDIWDFLYSLMWFKISPTFSVIGIPINPGLYGYWLSRNSKVPFVGAADIIKLPQSGTTYHGGYSDGFSVKDLSRDIFKFWVLKQLLGALGPQGLSMLLQAIMLINRYRQPKMSDIILRISPLGASLKFDDDIELSMREELNYIVNYINQTLLYLMDPSHTVRPTLMSVSQMKGEPNIGT